MSPTSVVAPLVPRTKSKFTPMVHVSVVADNDAPATKLPCAGSGPVHRELRRRHVRTRSAKLTLSFIGSFRKS